MNILYVSTVCSDKKFKEIFENSKVKPQQQAQKFHKLLIKGLLKLGNNLYLMSRLPINKSTDKKVKTFGLKEKGANITYNYLKILEIPIIKYIILFVDGFINTMRWNFKNRKQDRIIICDVLNLSISISALLVSKICNVKSIAIVTDIPNYMQNYTMQKKTHTKQFVSNLYTKICNYFIQKYDSYIILTEQMNELVNRYNKPYKVIEGIVDSNMMNVENLLQNKYKEKVVIYAGSLKEMSGMKKFINAFTKLKDDEARLWIYGSGELENEIKNYEQRDHRIGYFGVVSNEEVVKEQLKATLLVNPRPSNEEFTKYSFPSKNMEYMVSGTPILTTPLQGMPKEYNDYVYLFEDETVDGMTKTLEDILRKDKEELHMKGLRAKEFVLREKNNVVQANKVLDIC